MESTDELRHWRDLATLLTEQNSALLAQNEELRQEIGEWKANERRVRESEIQLKDSEARLRQVIDAIPSLSWCNLPHGPNEFLSKSWHEYTGLSPEEAHGWGWQSTFHADDLPPLMTKWQELIISGQPGEIEARIRRSDGVFRWFLIKVAPLRDEMGAIIRWYGTSTDINDRKLAEEALQRSQETLSSIINTIPTTAWTTRPDGYCEFLNKRWLDYAGMTTDEARGWGWGATIHPSDRDGLVKYWQACLESGTPVDTEARMRRFDGVYRWFIFRANPLRDSAGEIVQWFGTNIDIEDRKYAEQALRDSERDIRLIVDTIPGLVCTLKANWEVETVNKPLRDYFGMTLEELKDWQFIGVVHPDDLERVVAETHRSVQSGQPYEVEHRCRRHDGVFRWFQIRCNPLHDQAGQIVRWYLLLTDIEDRRLAEEAVRESEQKLTLIINTMPMLVWSTQADGMLDFVNEPWLSYTGLSSATALGWGWTDAVHPEDKQGLFAYWQTIMGTGEAGEYEARLRRSDGVYRWFLFRASPLMDGYGKILRWYGSNTDIEDRKLAEEALRERELNLRQITETIPEMLWSSAPDGSIDYCNGRLLEFTGFSADEIKGGGWIKLLHPDDVEHAVKVWTHCVESGDPYRVEVRTIHAPDRTYRLCVTRALPLVDLEGRIVKWHGTVVDMHDWKLAQEELRHTQAELARAMRVLTMGQLTASIAHEVNQPLSGIITNANTCLRLLNVNPPNIEAARETALRTIRDGNRAADVISRLRSFFGKKQIADDLIDLNEAAREIIALQVDEFQRNGVIVRHEFEEGLPLVRGDRVQIQQVILNLVRNASDAMKALDERPRLMLLKTDRGEDGDVRLTVEDAGPGFHPEAASRLFEPFYTTKNDGMGIGLSLSRSIVEAHQGRLWAETRQEYGATFIFSIPCRPTTVNEAADASSAS